VDCAPGETMNSPVSKGTYFRIKLAVQVQILNLVAATPLPYRHLNNLGPAARNRMIQSGILGVEGYLGMELGRFSRRPPQYNPETGGAARIFDFVVRRSWGAL
jgi:hypothetical protein